MSTQARWIIFALLGWALKSSARPEKSAGDYFVHSLPGAPEGPLVKMHAGHIEVDAETGGNLFFWHYQNRHIANRQRTVIWLNGGPGCSSEDGALMEIGPYRVTSDGNLTYNDGSWNEFTNLLFVDQPVGTGFSFVSTDSYIHELTEMADHFIVFLEKFFALFPQYEHDDLYISGESYAGQHIPYIAKAILDRNKGNVKHKWLLEGLLIGNGWIAPLEQYQAYLTYAYEEGLVTRGSAIAKKLESQQAICLSQLSEPGGNKRVDIEACESILQDMLDLTKVPAEPDDICLNVYDTRLRDTYPSCGMNWPPDLPRVTDYLRRPDVVAALNVSPDKKAGWTECAAGVSSTFHPVKSVPAIDLLPGLLEELRIVLFSGDRDIICNHRGTEEFINSMSWNGGTGFELAPGTWAPRRDWTFEGEKAGIYQDARNLTYVLFYNASHMVPFDYPRRSRDMLDRFIKVDIASIGGPPADSRIDGEKGLEVSVGGHPNSTTAEKEAADKLQQAKWDAYYKSGEIALVVVMIAAGIWGWYIYRDRRRFAGYQGLFGGSSGPRGGGGGGAASSHGRRRSQNGHISFGSMPSPRDARHANSGVGLENFRSKRPEDLEAGDFDETELDHLHKCAEGDDTEREQYTLGIDSDDEEYADADDAGGEQRRTAVANGKKPDR